MLIQVYRSNRLHRTHMITHTNGYILRSHARFCAARRLDPNSNLSTAQQSRALAVRTPNILAHARSAECLRWYKSVTMR